MQVPEVSEYTPLHPFALSFSLFELLCDVRLPLRRGAG
jgi:hypothetical protein